MYDFCNCYYKSKVCEHYDSKYQVPNFFSGRDDSNLGIYDNMIPSIKLAFFYFIYNFSSYVYIYMHYQNYKATALFGTIVQHT